MGSSDQATASRALKCQGAAEYRLHSAFPRLGEVVGLDEGDARGVAQRGVLADGIERRAHTAALERCVVRQRLQPR